MAERAPAFVALKRDIADAVQHHGKWLNSHEVITALEEALVEAWELAFGDGPPRLLVLEPGVLELLKEAGEFIADEADNRAAAGSEHSDYEREPRELARRISAAIAGVEQ